MANFFIDGFDFGVDTTRSSLEFSEGTFNLNLVGDDAIVSDILEHEDHLWNWLIQPPFLYMRDVLGQTDSKGNFEHEITEQDLDDYDIALYVGEHFDVLPCKVLKQGTVVTVSGKVHGLREAPVEFHGEFTVATDS